MKNFFVLNKVLNKIKYSNEYEILRKLDYINIIKIVDAFEENDFLYYVTQYIEGVTLEKFIKTSMVNDYQIINLVLDLAKTLEYMHYNFETPLIHGDINPNNLIVDNFLNIFLIDFDASFYYNKCLERMIYGTYGFYSPEQILFPSKVNIFSDIYSFGKVVLYIMEEYFILELYQIAKKCVSINPNDRPNSITDVLQEIKLIL